MKVNEAIEKIKELDKQIVLLGDTIKSLEEESDRTQLLESIIAEKQKERDGLQKRLDVTDLAPETLYFRGGQAHSSEITLL